MIDSAQTGGEKKQPVFSFQVLRPDLYGLVFHVSWIFLLFYSDTFSCFSGREGYSVFDIGYLSSVLSLLVVLGAGVIRPRCLMYFAESKAGSILVPIVTALGTVLYCMNELYSSIVFLIVGGLLTGVGSAVLAARWASIFGGVAIRTLICNMPALIALIVTLCVSMNYVPRTARFVLLVALPLCSGCFLSFSRWYQKSWPDTAKRVRMPLSYGKGAVVFLVALVVLVSFTAALLACFQTSIVSYSLFFYLVAAVLVLGFAGTYMFLTDKAVFTGLFVVPMVLLVLVMLPFARFVTVSFGEVFYPLGNISLEVTLLFGTVLFALVSDRSPARCFMAGRIAYALADLAGSWVGIYFVDSITTDFALQISGVILLVASEFLLLVLVICFLFALSNSARFPRLTFVDVDSPEESPSFSFGKQGEEGYEKEAEEESERSVSSAENYRELRLRELAERFGLTSREVDVARLLAEGRSYSYIQDKLCISVGTVNFHTRNVYQKLGVHSRQEVIDLVLGTDSNE